MAGNPVMYRPTGLSFTSRSDNGDLFCKNSGAGKSGGRLFVSAAWAVESPSACPSETPNQIRAKKPNAASKLNGQFVKPPGLVMVFEHLTGGGRRRKSRCATQKSTSIRVWKTFRLPSGCRAETCPKPYSNLHFTCECKYQFTPVIIMDKRPP